jgi:hypothetical protein
MHWINRIINAQELRLNFIIVKYLFVVHVESNMEN